MKMLLFNMLLLIIPVFGLHLETSAQTVRPGNITEVILETGDGFCADCERIITLRADGSASFHGGRNSRVRAGNFTGGISKKKFAKLSKTIIEAGFFKLKDRYEGDFLDVANVEITIVYTGGRKTVVNSGRSNEPKLKALERAIDTAASQIQWRNNTEAAPHSNN